MDIHYQRLLQNIRELVPIEKNEVAVITDAFKPVTLNKKEFYIRKGDLSNHMNFVSEGCLKVYSIDEKGMEHILQFGIAGWWVSDLYAYLTETPSTLFIQAVANSTLLHIHRDRLELLFDLVPMMDRFFRIKTQKGYVALQDRTIRSMSESAEQRYSQFVNRYREMEQQIPQYMIASYLGITPEHLSTIRKKMSKTMRS